MITFGLFFLMYFIKFVSGLNDKLFDVENGFVVINIVILLEFIRREK